MFGLFKKCYEVEYFDEQEGARLTCKCGTIANCYKLDGEWTCMGPQGNFRSSNFETAAKKCCGC